MKGIILRKITTPGQYTSEHELALDYNNQALSFKNSLRALEPFTKDRYEMYKKYSEPDPYSGEVGDICLVKENDKLNFYVRKIQGWEKVTAEGFPKNSALSLFERKVIPPANAVKRDGSVKIQNEGYREQIGNKNYMDNFYNSKATKRVFSKNPPYEEFPNNYSSHEFQPMAKKELLNGDVIFVPPTEDPKIEGVLWNDRGVLKVSYGEFTSDYGFIARIWTVDNSKPDVPVAQVNIQVLDKHYMDDADNQDLGGDLAGVIFKQLSDKSWLVFSNAEWAVFGKTNIKKIDFLECKMKSLYSSFYSSDDLEEIKFSCDTSTLQSLAWACLHAESLKSFTSTYGKDSFPNVTTLCHTWHNCVDLEELTVWDTRNVVDFSYAWHFSGEVLTPEFILEWDYTNGTKFYATWAYSSLTSFPEIDVSNGADFSYAWAYCLNLASFPQLDVPNGADFSYAWYNCTTLPHCPAGNEVTIPAGANTDNMCGGSCCGGKE